jgi:hypothetical protein
MRRIAINLQPSRQYIFFIILVLIATLGIIFTLPINFKWEICAVIGVMGYGGYQLWCVALMKGRGSILRVSYDRSGWEIEDKSQTYVAKIGGDSTLTSFLLVLRFKVEGSRKIYPCLVFKDSVGADIFREFTVRVRHG